VSDALVVLAIARKDLLQELRSRAATVATLFFSAVTLVMMAFALGRDSNVLREAAPGVLWVALAFAGVIAAAQNFQADLEEGAFEQLLLQPVPRAAIYLGKLLANWLYLTLLGVLLSPVAFVLYGVELAAGGILWHLATLLLGTFGFAVIATFYAGLTANLAAREALLPVLMFPVIVPVMLGAVRATEALMGGAPTLATGADAFAAADAALAAGNAALAADWLQLLAGFGLVYFVVCTAIFHFVVDE